jgi:ribosome recycling factor
MAYNFSNLKTNIKNTEEWLKKELTSMRTGRANTIVLDSIQAEVYGSYMPLNQLANISVEDARTIRIAPWDNSAIKPIEKAITNSNLGLSASVDDKGVRLFFPELTGEKRTLLVKVAKDKMEESRIALRKERETEIKNLDVAEKNGTISEDEKFRAKEEIQKLIDEANKKLEELFDAKEKEIMQ